uniref:Uncharacterized protein n=1 Tax=Timema shepardi TaxID=629360 RepID=A0A7R9APE2_TIMSH|nr:unnamed protein product [Timema shepardi]
MFARSLDKALKSRFSFYDSDPIFCPSMLCDPRFRGVLIDDMVAVNTLAIEVKKLSDKSSLEPNVKDEHPSCSSSSSGLWSSFDSIPNTTQPAIDNNSEVKDYLNEPRMVLEGMLGGSRSPLYSAVSNPSLRGRNKMEALDNLVMAAVCGLSNKLRGSSCALLRKLRFVYEEDSERSEKLSCVIELLENSACGSPQTKSPSKELSGTLKNLKKLENVIKVLDEVLFDEEEFELEVEEY